MRNVATYNSVADGVMYSCKDNCKACIHPVNNATEIALCRHFLNKKNLTNKVVGLDIGAHAGIYSIALRNHVSQMYSFELDPFTYSTLLRNSKNYTNIIPFNKAVWDKNENNVEIFKEAAKTYYNFECISLDTFEPLPDPQTIGFIKIDIEGAEVNALRGMEEILKKCTNTVMEIEYCKRHFDLFKTEDKEFFDILKRTGFEYTGIYPMDLVINAGYKNVLNLFYTK